MIFGRVIDPAGAVVAGASVTVTNIDTKVALNFTTNDTGYYEAALLLPGNYEVEADQSGFKRIVRRGITLNVASHLEVDLKMEIGGMTERVEVTAEAPLLETNAVTSGRVLDRRTIMDLPTMGNILLTLVEYSPGMQSSGDNPIMAMHSISAGSEYYTPGHVGQNAWTVDGTISAGASHQVAYLPHTDTISEFKVETNNFDASLGQTTGASITMIGKSGTNDFHGTLTWQHWQQRWQATPFFSKQQYYQKIAAAEAAGDPALAEQLRNTPKQSTGRSNNWAASGGGPVIIPKIYNGKDKLFWYFNYNAIKDVKTETAASFNQTVPTLLAREGDFSDMLNLPNASAYIVYDPTTVTQDPARPSNYVRTPFPGNVIPKSRFVNPVYNKYLAFYPKPNNAIAAGSQPVNNYLATKMPYNWNYKAFASRIDYQASNKVRMFGRWEWNEFGPEDRGDWAYETARGLTIGGLVRNNKGANFDTVITQSAATMWDINIGINQFRDGNVQPAAYAYKPSDVGLPAYLDQHAGSMHLLPQMTINGYSNLGPSGYSKFIRYRLGTGKVEMTHIHGNHSIHAAFDTRQMFRTGGGGGNTSGNFSFDPGFVKKYDDGKAAYSNLGLSWASFILGIPSGGTTIADNDSYAMKTPYYAGYVQDNWRVTPNLTLNLGLRLEYEGGATERYNRMLGGFDPTMKLPITDAAEAAYAASPVSELAASNFKVIGGSLYPGTNGQPRNLITGAWMPSPRLGLAYRWNNKTVLRAGYGIYYDTNNVLNFGPNQTGYSVSTSTTLSTDAGMTWNLPDGASPANYKSPLNDPFPVRADGTRFDKQVGNALGIMAKAGRGWGFTGYDQPHAKQQRWRLAVQRQFGSSWAIEAAYSGSYSDQIALERRMDYLPRQYWTDGSVRNTAWNDNFYQQVKNPFYIANFASLKESSPLIYNNVLANGSFFKAKNIVKTQLLRNFTAFSNNLYDETDPNGWSKTHQFDLTVEKHFSKGFSLNAGYTRLYTREATFYLMQYDTTPTARESNSARPHKIVASGIYEFPFGKGKRLLGNAGKALDLVVGGWQTGAAYMFQPGPLIGWNNYTLYYGSNYGDICSGGHTYSRWFNTDNFERNANNLPYGYQTRVFPTRIPGCRADISNNLNANLAKNIKFDERWTMQLRVNVQNVQNRSQMDSPNTDPTSTNFGKITSQANAINRRIDVQARITF